MDEDLEVLPRNGAQCEWVTPKEECLPLTLIGVEHVAAYFKAGGYRSYPNYLSAMKQAHIEPGHDWSAQLD